MHSVRPLDQLHFIHRSFGYVVDDMEDGFRMAIRRELPKLIIEIFRFKI